MLEHYHPDMPIRNVLQICTSFVGFMSSYFLFHTGTTVADWFMHIVEHIYMLGTLNFWNFGKADLRIVAHVKVSTRLGCSALRII